jgi:hypothetical protein
VPDRPAMGVVLAVHFQSESQPVVANLLRNKGVLIPVVEFRFSDWLELLLL